MVQLGLLTSPVGRTAASPATCGPSRTASPTWP
jgi:hypothetical protein